METLIRRPEDIIRLTQKWGFLPFFKNEIPGFSIEEHTPEDLWFSREQDGPWEWKGPVIESLSVAYGKFFRRKAGFVSLDLLGDFLRLRRRLYPVKEGSREAHLLEVLSAHESLLSREWKSLSGFSFSADRHFASPLERMAAPSVNQSSRLKAAFEQAVAGLEMGVHVVTATFEYKMDGKGQPYGWGVARYCKPELLYGFFEEGREREEKLLGALLERPLSFFPGYVSQISRLIG